MLEAFCLVGFLIVAFWAVALVVIETINACAGLASSQRAVIGVIAEVRAISGCLVETKVTITFVVVQVFTCGLSLVHTLAIEDAQASLAIIQIPATIMLAVLTIRLATGLKGCLSTHAAIERVARQAFEC